MSKTIEQTVHFKATPHAVYETLMDSDRHSAFTGGEASLSREIGGEIHAYGGYISGENMQLIPDRKIVQLWRAVDWPAGHFSTVTFLLTSEGEGTRLDFTQTGVPDGTEEMFADGWVENYWEPMKALLEK